MNLPDPDHFDMSGKCWYGQKEKGGKQLPPLHQSSESYSLNFIYGLLLRRLQLLPP
jgi:hypothetical protein